MNEIKVIINDIEINATAGDTILKIATDNNIEIPTLCYHENVSLYGACGLCLVEVENMPKLLRACSSKATDGMKIYTESERVVQARKIALELLMSDHDGDCKGPCTLNCPAETDCQGYVNQIALGNDYEAVKIIKEKLPLPASIGRVCPHPCETACRRENVEEPVSIGLLKAFTADKDLMSDNPYRPEVAEPTGKKVGIIGGGPAGLTAAYFLATKGDSVTIFDKQPDMGGMLRYGIPEYRLPKSVVSTEVKAIQDLGVELINGFEVGKDKSLAELKKDFDALIVAIGAWSSMKVGCKGDDLKGVYGGIEFLEQIALGEKPEFCKKVAVVGGGNTAMDACRSVVRLGAEEVYVIYRRTRAEMPAEDIEIEEAMEEGIKFKFLTNPVEIIGENGRVSSMKLQVMKLGDPDASGRRAPVPVEGKFEIIDVDCVISAIGQKVNIEGFEDLELNERGIISADEKTFRTSKEGIFAVGDSTNCGAGIAIEAIAEAYKASSVVHGYLLGMDIPYRKPFYSERVLTEDLKHQLSKREKITRAKMPHRKPEERKKDFIEVNLGFEEKIARAEAARCLECGCHDYGDCKLIKYGNCYDINPARIAGEEHHNEKETKLICIERNNNKCILCGLCVRTCYENAEKGILDLVGRGFGTVVKPEFDNPETIEFCKTCLQCANICPTGALKIIED